VAGIFGGDCPVCAANAGRITFLEGQVVALQKQLIELASPGANARLAWTPPKPAEKSARATHSPSQIAARRADKPSPEAPPPALRVSEADFEAH